MTWSVPTVRRVGGCPEHWVVTGCDQKFFPWMAAFLGSLRDIAGFRGRVAVIDFGLEQCQQKLLESMDVTLIAPLLEAAMVVDRYFTLVEFFASRPHSLIAHFDADVWFAGPLDDLFANPELQAGRLGATIDVIPCDYYYGCSRPDYHPQIETMLSDVCSRFGEALQAGVIVGSTQAWGRYVQRLRKLFSSGWIRGAWGSDALALNYTARDEPAGFTLLPITWNAPPLWGFRRSGTDLFVDRWDTLPTPINVVHRTSGVRGNTEYDISAQSVHPQLEMRWLQRFKLISLP